MQKSSQKKLLSAIIALFWFGQYVYVPYQTVYLGQLGIPASYIGIVIGAYGGFQLLLRFPIGIMADQTNRHKRQVLFSLAASGTASLLRALIPSGASFLIANLLSGIGSAMWMSYILLFSALFGEEDRRNVMGQTVLFQNIGVMSGFILSSLLYARFGMTFLCIASVLAAITALILLSFVRESPSAPRKVPTRELVGVYKDRTLVGFSLLTLVQQGIQAATAMSFTAQKLRALGASDQIIGLSAVFYMLVAVISARIFSSPWGNRREPSFWIPALFALFALYCCVVGFSQRIALIFAAQIIPGLGNGILLPLLTSEAVRKMPQEKMSSSMGFFQSIYSLGILFYPMIAGALLRRFSWEVALCIMGATAIPCCIVSKITYKNRCKLNKGGQR